MTKVVDFFTPERRNYYSVKRAERRRKEQSDQVIKEDALFIKYYGMSAYLELFPEAKGFSITWHRRVLEELQKMDRRNLASELSGQALAYAATQDKKAGRKFKRVIKDMLK